MTAKNGQHGSLLLVLNENHKQLLRNSAFLKFNHRALNDFHRSQGFRKLSSSSRGGKKT